MLYTELLKLWDEAVQAADAKDWEGSLAKLNQISEPTSRTLFNAASAYLALGDLEQAAKALDFTIAKDQRLAVGFFQRAAVMMQIDRLEEALSDCIWAQKHMRGNRVIDYRQLGLRYRLFSWQLLYNAAAVNCRMGQWEQAKEMLLSASQEKEGRGGSLEVALDAVMREEILAPLLVPEGAVFRPRKQDIEQLQQKDFLGKAKVIYSVVPNDDFGGFEPFRLQKPGFYEPKTDGSQDTRYMRVKTPYISRGQGQLTVPGGAMVFIFAEEDRDGMVMVIWDGQRGLLPVSLLEPVDVKSSKGKKDNGVPSGIPLPPGLKPPTRPKPQSSSAAPPRAVSFSSTDTPPPSYTTATHAPLPAPEPPRYTANAASDQNADSAQGAEAGSVVVKVHYTYTVALSVPLDTQYSELKERIAQKLGQPASQLRLRHKLHGSRALIPLGGEEEPGRMVQEVAEAGRATLWCQKEDPLANRPILCQMVALYDYSGQGPEDLEFSEGDTIDILGEVNEEWLEGHCAGNIGIFPSCFAYRENMGEGLESLL